LSFFNPYVIFELGKRSYEGDNIMEVALIIFLVVAIIFVIVIVKTPIKDVLVEGIKMFKDISEQNEIYMEADIEDLVKLDDHDLYEAIGDRLLSKIDVDKNYEISFSSLGEYEQTFWVVYEFDAEVLNGGLCQYFGNTRGRYCGRIVDDLKKIGADDYASLYSDFVKENKINGDEFANDLNEDWETSYNKYSYESFDDAFSKLYMEEKALDSYLAEYVRANSEYFK